MTDLFKAATKSVPFANGTEGEAWMDKWCAYCAHDHGIHKTGGSEPMCELIGNALLGGEFFQWPEAWLPEPPGLHSIPSHLICEEFKPCTTDTCTGDPATQARTERTAKAKTTWETELTNHHTTVVES